VWEGAELARALGISRITVCEFGVAGGKGLLELERIAEEAERATGVGIDVVGFDSGRGLPPPRDYRDVPHFWAAGNYKMDERVLRAKLRRAQLVLGDVGTTVPAWLPTLQAPLAFIAFDLDYYSSTVDAFRIFDGPPSTRLPRVFSYFDDVIYPERAYLNEYVGEELAIREFNAAHGGIKICQVKGLSHIKGYRAVWHDEMYCVHDFHHPLYTVNVHPKRARAAAAVETPSGVEVVANGA
jgi:hypothetical protein